MGLDGLESRQTLLKERTGHGKGRGGEGRPEGGKGWLTWGCLGELGEDETDGENQNEKEMEEERRRRRDRDRERRRKETYPGLEEGKVVSNKGNEGGESRVVRYQGVEMRGDLAGVEETLLGDRRAGEEELL